MRLIEAAGDSWDSERLRWTQEIHENYREHWYSWDSGSLIEPHETHGDYWTLTRLLRIIETNGESWDSERVTETHESQGNYWGLRRLIETARYSWKSKRLLWTRDSARQLATHETHGDSCESGRLLEYHATQRVYRVLMRLIETSGDSWIS